MNFTTNEFRSIVDALKAEGHGFLTFADTAETEKFVYMRHDIDFSLAEAVQMAEVEHEMGIRSTYFALLTAPYYNPLSEEGTALLRQIVQLGHELGLHYDASVFEGMTVEACRQRVASLAQVLGDHVGHEVRCIAQHKPASSSIHLDFPDFINAYEDRFFKDIPYISDSRKMFRIDDVFAFIKSTPRCQIALHPLWWTEEPTNRAQDLERIAAHSDAEMKRMLAGELAHIDRFLEKYYAND